jgi:hypothetical protein
MWQQRKAVQERKVAVEIERHRAGIGSLHVARQACEQCEEPRVHIVATEPTVDRIARRKRRIGFGMTRERDAPRKRGETRHDEAVEGGIEGDEEHDARPCPLPAAQPGGKQKTAGNPTEREGQATDLRHQSHDQKGKQAKEGLDHGGLNSKREGIVGYG